jgi:hypothetical protein
MKQNEPVNHGRRKFLNFMKDAGLVVIAHRAVLPLVAATIGASAAVQSCGGSGSSGGSSPAPDLASKFTVNYASLPNEQNQWQIYGPNGTPALKSGKRHSTTLTFRPHEDITASLGYVLRAPNGKVEWSFYTQPQAFQKDVQVTTPILDIPIKNSQAGGAYDLEFRVNDGTQEDSLMHLAPQVTWGQQNTVSTYNVREALNWIARQYDGNPNPGMITIVGDNADALDVQGAVDITNRITADALAQYGQQPQYENVSPVLLNKLASEKPVLDGNSGFVIGRSAFNPRVAELLAATSTVVPTEAGFLKPYDLKDGSVYVLVGGDISSILINGLVEPDLHPRRASRVISTHDLHNLSSNQRKVTGNSSSYQTMNDALADLVVAQA